MECAGPESGLGVFAGEPRPTRRSLPARENPAVTGMQAPAGAASTLTAIESARLSRPLIPPAIRHPGFLPGFSALTKRRSVRRSEAAALSLFQK